jgi:hypothetical protein
LVLRGLPSCDEAQRTDEYFEAKKGYTELRGLLTKARGDQANQ